MTQVHALLPTEPAYAVVEVPGAERVRCQTAAVQPEANRTVWQETLEVRQCGKVCSTMRRWSALHAC